MKNVYLSFILFSFCINCFSQNFQWARQEGSWYTDNCRNGTTDNAGNTYVIISTYEDININGILYTWCAQPTDILVKYSPTGNVLWARTICARGTIGMTTDNTGNCIVGGDAIEGDTFQNGAGGYDTMHTANRGQAFMVKYSPDGNLIWHINYHPTGATEYFTDIVADANDNLYALVSADTFYISRFIITKFSSSGNLIWEKPASPVSYDIGCQIAIDGSSNLYIQGSTSAPLSLAGHTINANDSIQTFLIKMDSSGNVSWIKEYYGFVHGTEMGITASGNIILSGNSYYYPTTFGSYTVAAEGWFIAQFDTSGNITWLKTTTAQNTNLAIDNDLIYFSGHFLDTAYFPQDSITLFANNKRTFFIMQLDAAANVKWTYQNSATNNAALYLANIDTDPSGDISMSGLFSGVANYGNLSLQCYDTGAFREDVFVVKMSKPVINGIHENAGGINAVILPNSSSGVITINNIDQKKAVNICVYDLLGNCLWSEKIQGDPSPKIDMSNQSKGIYFMEVVTDGARAVKKIIIQ